MKLGVNTCLRVHFDFYTSAFQLSTSKYFFCAQSSHKIMDLCASYLASFWDAWFISTTKIFGVSQAEESLPLEGEDSFSMSTCPCNV